MRPEIGKKRVQKKTARKRMRDNRPKAAKNRQQHTKKYTASAQPLGTFLPTLRNVLVSYNVSERGARMVTVCVVLLGKQDKTDRPAIQPWDWRTWWNQRDGRKRASPALIVTSSGRAFRYCGYRTRSGFSGSIAIHGT